MARDDTGPHQEPEYDPLGAPADAADLTELGKYAAYYGNTALDTAAARAAAESAGQTWNGLTWVETDTGLIYRRIGGAWVLQEVATKTSTIRARTTSLNLTGAVSPIDFNSSIEDSGDFTYAAPSGVGTFTCVRPGRYQINAQLSVATAGAAVGWLGRLLKNSTSVMQNSAISSVTGGVTVTLARTLLLATGDTVQLAGFATVNIGVDVSANIATSIELFRVR